MTSVVLKLSGISGWYSSVRQETRLKRLGTGDEKEFKGREVEVRCKIFILLQCMKVMDFWGIKSFIFSLEEKVLLAVIRIILKTHLLKFTVSTEHLQLS